MMIKTIKKTSWGAPIQFEGKLETGEYFYFRARYKRATLEIAKSKVCWKKGSILFFREKEYNRGDFYCSFLTNRICIKLIDKWVKEYLKDEK